MKKSPYQKEFKILLKHLFAHPEPDRIKEKIITFLKKTPLPMDDFPLPDGTYSRTILYKAPNGYEAMAARWSPGAVSSVHGHPQYALIIGTRGRLKIENFKKNEAGLEMTSSEVLSDYRFFSGIGREGRFDNHIHRVEALEESLSVHISSDDATKGDVYPS
jgi:hypothetical protein